MYLFDTEKHVFRGSFLICQRKDTLNIYLTYKFRYEKYTNQRELPYNKVILFRRLLFSRMSVKEYRCTFHGKFCGPSFNKKTIADMVTITTPLNFFKFNKVQDFIIHSFSFILKCVVNLHLSSECYCLYISEECFSFCVKAYDFTFIIVFVSPIMNRCHHFPYFIIILNTSTIESYKNQYPPMVEVIQGAEQTMLFSVYVCHIFKE